MKPSSASTVSQTRCLRYREEDRAYLLAALREQFSMSCAEPIAGAEVSCLVQDAGLLRGLSYTQAPFPSLESKRLLYRIEFKLASNCHACLPLAWGELAKSWHQQAVIGMHGVEASNQLVKSTGRRKATLSGVFGSHPDCPQQVGMHTVFLSIVSENKP